MLHLGVSDWLLLAVGAYFAVVTLIGLMRRRRDVLVQELAREAELQQQQKMLAEKREKAKQAAAANKAATKRAA